MGMHRMRARGTALGRGGAAGGWAGTLGIVVAAACLVGCGAPAVTTAGEPAASPYAGPLQLPQNFRDRASVAERGGAATRALASGS